MLYPYDPQSMYGCPDTAELKRTTLSIVEPWVRNGMREAQTISVEHALKEAAAVSYLIGKGYSPTTAHQIVESWWRK